MVTSRQVQEFLEARQQGSTDSETFRNARQALLACDKTEVLAQFETRLQVRDEEERASAIAGLAALYGVEATDTLVRWITDPSSTVRWVVCCCLHDCGDVRAAAALLDRLKHDADCQVRGVAAGALGQIGALEALPDLHQAHQTDFEVDELGHSPSWIALDAMTEVLSNWVTRQIQGTPPRRFRESTGKGQLTGTVTAEGIPIDAEGRINRTLRYAHVPQSSFGNGWASKMDLQTSLIDPFEIEVEYVDPTCVIQRLLIYQRITDWDKFNWSGFSILDPTAMNASITPAHRQIGDSK